MDREPGEQPTPVPVLDSATVLVVRRAGDDAREGSVEVLLLRRNDRSGFVAGATLYPGGAIDPHDALVPWSVSSGERVPGGHGVAAIAAARECFEEAGILLAVDERDHWAHPGHVDALGRAPSSFGPSLREHRLHVPVDRFVPFGRWVTPLGASRRYDTRFFVVEAPPDAVIRVDGREIVAAAWWDPRSALAAERDGELRFVTPTRKTLDRLAQHEVPAGVLRSPA